MHFVDAGHTNPTNTIGIATENKGKQSKPESRKKRKFETKRKEKNGSIGKGEGVMKGKLKTAHSIFDGKYLMELLMERKSRPNFHQSFKYAKKVREPTECLQTDPKKFYKESYQCENIFMNNHLILNCMKFLPTVGESS